MTWEKDVYSDMVSKVGYDAETKELFVTFKRGKRAIYEGVSEELALDLSKAASVGGMMNTEIKPYYKFRYG